MPVRPRIFQLVVCGLLIGGAASSGAQAGLWDCQPAPDSGGWLCIQQTPGAPARASVVISASFRVSSSLSRISTTPATIVVVTMLS